MNSRWSVLGIGLLSLSVGGVAGCKKDDPPKPDPAATATATGRSKLNVRNPMNPVTKLDPQVMKDYRLDICYYGTMSLRQARDAYFASLGKDEPNEKKIPNFGAASTATPGGPGAPAASGSAKAGPSAAAKPATPPAAPKPSGSAAAGKPAASGSAAAAVTPPPTMPERRPFDVFARAPHERHARVCTIAASLKEPAMGDVDKVVAEFAPFAVELSKDIATATAYYQKEEYKKDNFAKGKELHKKFVERFDKLDQMSDKLGNALAAWRKEHPADASKQDEGEKLTHAAIEDARAIFMSGVAKKGDQDTLKPMIEKLEKSVGALKEFAGKNAADQWGKIMAGPFDVFLKAAKEAKANKDNSLEPESYLTLINNFTGLVESRQRAISRAQMAKAQATAAPQPTAPAPAPTAEQK